MARRTAHFDVYKTVQHYNKRINQHATVSTYVCAQSKGLLCYMAVVATRGYKRILRTSGLKKVKICIKSEWFWFCWTLVSVSEWMKIESRREWWQIYGNWWRYIKLWPKNVKTFMLSVGVSINGQRSNRKQTADEISYLAIRPSPISLEHLKIMIEPKVVWAGSSSQVHQPGSLI